MGQVLFVKLRIVANDYQTFFLDFQQFRFQTIQITEKPILQPANDIHQLITAAANLKT